MLGLLLATLLAVPARAAPEKPRLGVPAWTIATNPDLGTRGTAKQQPVDFGIWQAADGTWQLWSCVRGTAIGGQSRLFYRWEGSRLTVPDWKPLGIALQADPRYGETPGGLQAPFVFREGDTYYMFYGDWVHICAATSKDGKTFVRRLAADGTVGMFHEGAKAGARDPMVIKIGNLWHCYYTAHPNRQGAVYCRTSGNLVDWSESRIVAFGGQAGTQGTSAECPLVIERERGFYLFRTQRYGTDARTSVYYSLNPLEFGINNDSKYLLEVLPIAAPEIVVQHGKYYIAYLLANLKGIQIAPLVWERPGGPAGQP